MDIFVRDLYQSRLGYGLMMMIGLAHRNDVCHLILLNLWVFHSKFSFFLVFVCFVVCKSNE